MLWWKRARKLERLSDRKLFVFWGQPSLSKHQAATSCFWKTEKRDQTVSITSMSKTLCAPNQSAGCLLKHNSLPLSGRQTFLCFDYQNCHTQPPSTSRPSDVGICPQPQKLRCRLHVTSAAGSQQVLGRKQKSLYLEAWVPPAKREEETEKAARALDDVCSTAERPSGWEWEVCSFTPMDVLASQQMPRTEEQNWYSKLIYSEKEDLLIFEQLASTNFVQIRYECDKNNLDKHLCKCLTNAKLCGEASLPKVLCCLINGKWAVCLLSDIN